MRLRMNTNDTILSIIHVCFYITVLSNLMIYITLPLNIILLATLASRCYILCNLITFLAAVILCTKKYMPYRTNQILIIIFMLLFSTISFVLSNGVTFFQYLTKILSYLAVPFYFLSIDYIIPKKKITDFVYLVNFLISIVFTFLSFSSYSYKGYAHYLGTKNAWLTLGFSNPNQTAMYLMLNFIVLFCTYFYYKKKLLRVTAFLFLIYIGKLLYNTSSRTCIITVIIIIAIILLKRKNQVSDLGIIAFLLIPTVFMILYPVLYKNGLFLQREILGKTDYGTRSIFYEQALNALKSNWLFGNYGKFRLANLHNGTLSVLSSLGIAGFISFYACYFRAHFQIKTYGPKSKSSFIAWIGLLAVFLHTCAESALITGGAMYAGSISVLIYLAKSDDKEVVVSESNIPVQLPDTASNTVQ